MMKYYPIVRLSDNLPIVAFSLVLVTPLVFTRTLQDNDTIQRFVFVVLSLLASISLFCISKRKFEAVNVNRYLFLLGIFIPLWWLCCAAVNRTVEVSVPDIFIIIQYLTFSFLVMVLFQHYGDRMIKAIAMGITVISVLISLAGLMQSFGYYIFSLPKSQPPASTLVDRVFAVEFIVGAIPWIIAFMYLSKNKRQLVVSGFCLCIAISYLLLMRGRAGYVAFAAGMILLFLFMFFTDLKEKLNYSSKRLIPFIVIILIIAGGAGFLETPNPSKRYSFVPTLRYIYDPHNLRLEYWQASVKMAGNSPVFGTGPGRWHGHYPFYSGEQYNDSNIYNAHINPHNDLMETLTETGIPGFFIYACLMGILLIILFRASFKKPVCLFIGISLLCIIIASMFSFTKDRTASMLFFCFAMGIAGSIKSSKPLHIRFQYVRIALLILFGISAIYAAARIYAEHNYLMAMRHKFNNNYPRMLNTLSHVSPYIFPVDFSQMPVDYYRGVGYYQLNDFPVALHYFQRALTMSPYTPTIIHNTASTYYQLKLKREALRLYHFLKQKFPNYVQPQIDMISVYANAKEHRKAKALLNELERKHHDTQTLINDSTFRAIKEFYQ